MMLPFPYIANTAGWITAEWAPAVLIYGVMRTPPSLGAGVLGNALLP